MRISWITFAPIRSEGGVLTSDVASARYRVLMPVRELKDHQHRLTPLGPNSPPAARAGALDADVLVFSKSFTPENEALAREAQARGLKVVFDVSDDHFDDPTYGPHYRAMTGLADLVVCNSPQMAEIVRRHARHAPVVIEDPFEGPRGQPRFAPASPLRLLWFGHPTNLDSLNGALEDLHGFTADRPVALTVMTKLTPGIEEACARMSERHAGRLALTPVAWSQAAQWQALADADIVIIPSLANAKKRAKSANRMIEALWAGTPVVSQPLPAYDPFAAWTPIAPTISEGLARLLAEADEAPGRIAQAQAYIEAHYAPARLGQQWREALEALIPAEHVPS